MTDKIVSHTPGPLFVRQPDEWPFHILTVNAEGQEVFQERRHAYGTSQSTVAEVLRGSCFNNDETRAAAIESNGRQVADAHLRAAAPELLVSLRNVMQWISNWNPDFEGDPEWPTDRDDAMRAIAKATGVQQ